MRMTLLVWVIRNKLARNLKRILDFAVALATMIMASPIMILTALAIKLDSPGSVLFRQTRVGKWGEQFPCYKFRSMYIDAEQRLKDLEANPGAGDTWDAVQQRLRRKVDGRQ